MGTKSTSKTNYRIFEKKKCIIDNVKVAVHLFCQSFFKFVFDKRICSELLKLFRSLCYSKYIFVIMLKLVSALHLHFLVVSQVIIVHSYTARQS